MPGLRSIPARSGRGRSWLWWGVLVACVGVCAANTNCEDAGVVVVATIFGTLAVVAVALAIAYFVLRRRNGGKRTFCFVD